MTIFELIDAGDAEQVAALLAIEPEAAASKDERGLTAIMRAAYAGGAVFEAVKAANPPLDAFDRIVVGETEGLPAPTAWSPDGFTPLHIAAFAHNAGAARALLEAGADPDVIARSSFAQVTPLGTCAFAGATDVARVLLEYGADASLATEERARPAEVARMNGNEELAQLLAS